MIVTEAFEPVPRETLQEAKNILSNCKKLICCRKSFGSFEKENEELLNWAQEKEIEIEFQNAGEECCQRRMIQEKSDIRERVIPGKKWDSKEIEKEDSL